ncbi:MAG: hypothetical protein JWO31_1246 [Phycisphaerales bacterium]|nr:hypothetical protein [Phycisphaerales bacterium]
MTLNCRSIATRMQQAVISRATMYFAYLNKSGQTRPNFNNPQ